MDPFLAVGCAATRGLPLEVGCASGYTPRKGSALTQNFTIDEHGRVAITTDTAVGPDQTLWVELNPSLTTSITFSFDFDADAVGKFALTPETARRLGQWLISHS